MKALAMRKVSMENGDYAWIECNGKNEKYTGWFLRTRVDGKIQYVNINNTDFMLSDTLFTNQNEENYILYYKVDALTVLKGFDFSSTTKEKILLTNMSTSVKKEIEYLEKLNNKKMNILKYGIIREFDNSCLWFEPITDTKDGFVLRDIDDNIISIFTESAI